MCSIVKKHMLETLLIKEVLQNSYAENFRIISKKKLCNRFFYQCCKHKVRKFTKNGHLQMFDFFKISEEQLFKTRLFKTLFKLFFIFGLHNFI